MKINFIGAIKDVTGSMTLLETQEGKLLVDCGLFQGTIDVQKMNKHLLPFEPSEIKAILLTHAHLDHCGYIPRLVKMGFRGSIHCTKETMKLARLIMTDSAQILDANEDHPLYGFYGPEDVLTTTSFFKVHTWNETFNVLGLQAAFHPSGHILGASFVELKGEKTLVFSGDLGRIDDPIIPEPDLCPPCDFLMIESTYGASVRKALLQDELKNFITKLKKENKTGLIASFAVARAQMLITLLYEYFHDHPEEKLRLYIDGPMMVEANKIYREFAFETKKEKVLKEALGNVEVIEHQRQFESAAKKDGAFIVLSSSGMLTGGRVWRYLEEWQDREDVVLFLPGFQGEGTPGRALANGIRRVKSDDGKIVHWRGDILTSSAFSSHADQNELLHWLKNVDKNTPIYINHGESESKEIFKEKLEKMGHTHVNVASGSIKV